MEITKPLQLEIHENDLTPSERDSIKKEVLSTQTLGDEESVHRKILDLLPKLIATRVQEIVPPDFELSSLELKFEVQGKLFGSGVGGEVVAKLSRKH